MNPDVNHAAELIKKKRRLCPQVRSGEVLQAPTADGHDAFSDTRQSLSGQSTSFLESLFTFAYAAGAGSEVGHIVSASSAGRL